MNKTFIAMLLAGTVASGCASTGTSGSGSADAPRDDCFFIREIRGWNAIDDQHLWIEVAGNDEYLLTMFTRCPGIGFSQVIVFADRSRRMCPNDFGRIIYRDTGMRRYCSIDTVEAVASREEAETLVETRNNDTEQE